MKPVTDPTILAELNKGSSGGGATAVSDPATLAQLEFDVDITGPVKDVRAALGKFKGRDRERALRLWADHYVAKERDAGGIGLAVDDRVRALARGTLVGSVLDELTAATSSAPYDESLAYQRARDRAYDRANPIESGAMQFGGAFLSAGAFIKLLRRLYGLTGAALPAALQAPTTTAGAIGRGLGYGVPAAAVHGYGAGEGGVQNRLNTASDYATFAAPFAVAAPLAINAGAAVARPVWRNARQAIASRRYGPQAASDRILRDEIERSGRSIQSHIDDLQAGQDAARMGSNSRARLPEVLADQSDSMQRLAGSVYRTGGRAGERIRDVLEARQRGPDNPYAPEAARPAATRHLEGQANDVLDAYDRALQVKTAGSARQVEAKLIADQRAKGRRLFEKARRESQPFDLRPVLQGMRALAQEFPPPFAARLERAARLFERQGKAVNNVGRFHASKQALDDMIERAQRSGDRHLTMRLQSFKDDLLAAVHKGGRNDAYKQARAEWGRDSRMRDALDAGRRALRDDSDITVAAYREMSPGEQQMTRIGLRDALRVALGPRRSGQNSTNILNQRRTQELLAEVIPQTRGQSGVFSNRRERFGDYVSRQNRMVATRNRTLGGSPTAQRLGDDAVNNARVADTLIEQFRSGTSLREIAIEYFAEYARRFFGWRDDVALRLARDLVETNPERRLATLTRLQQQVPPDRFEQMVTGLQELSRRAAYAAPRAALPEGETNVR